MAELQFDTVGQRYFETGVSHMVLFPGAPTHDSEITGVAWNGITSVSQSPDGGDANDQYADNIKYLALRGAENMGGTIEAFYYPPELKACIGRKSLGGHHSLTFAQQTKKAFSFAYLTVLGNDTEGVDYSEVLHIVYNATCSPIEKSYETINESPEAQTFSFEFNTVPLVLDTSKITKYSSLGTTHKEIKDDIDKMKASAVIEIEYIPGETSKDEADFYKNVKAMVYGSASKESKLPMPEEILNEFLTTVVKVA